MGSLMVNSFPPSLPPPSPPPAQQFSGRLILLVASSVSTRKETEETEETDETEDLKSHVRGRYQTDETVKQESAN